MWVRQIGFLEEFTYAIVLVTRSCCPDDSICTGWKLLGQQSQLLLLCPVRFELYSLRSQLVRHWLRCGKRLWYHGSGLWYMGNG